jgi:hypothetical protein
MKHEQNVLKIPLADLSEHPDLSLFPLASPEQAEGLITSIKAVGQLVPISVCPAPAGNYYVVDGRNRLRALAAAGIAAATCIQVDTNPLDYAIETAVARRQLTRSGIVLVLWMQHPELAPLRGDRTRGDLRPPLHKPLASSAMSLQDNTFLGLAEKYNVPRDYFTCIASIATKLGDDADAWAEVRRQILEEEISLPRLNAGIAGRQKTRGGKRSPTRYDSVFRRSLTGISNAFSNWQKLDAKIRAPLADQWANTLAHEELPDELRDRLLAALVTWPDAWRTRAVQELKRSIR